MSVNLLEFNFFVFFDCYIGSVIRNNEAWRRKNGQSSIFFSSFPGWRIRRLFFVFNIPILNLLAEAVATEGERDDGEDQEGGETEPEPRTHPAAQPQQLPANSADTA